MQLKIDHYVNVDFLDWLEKLQNLLSCDFVYRVIDNSTLWRNYDSVYKVKSLKWSKRNLYSSSLEKFVIPAHYTAKAGNSSLSKITVWSQDFDCFSLPEFAEILLSNIKSNKPIGLIFEMEYFQDNDLTIVKKLSLNMNVCLTNGCNLLMTRCHDTKNILLTNEDLPLNHIVRKTKFKPNLQLSTNDQYFDLLNQQIQQRDRVVFWVGAALTIGQVQSFENGIVSIAHRNNQETRVTKIKNPRNILVINGRTEDSLLEYLLSSQ